MKKIYNFTNIAAHYRSLIWSKLLNANEFDYHFFYGKNNSLRIKEIDFTEPKFKQQEHKLHQLKNIWIKGKILIWQSRVIKSCFKDEIDVVIFLGEFQVISTWIAMLICKLRNIKVVYWTHGLYGNESKFKKKIRVLFYKTGDHLLLYEKRGGKLLEKEGISTDKIKVIYNSLDYDTHLILREKIAAKKVNVFENDFTFENLDLPYLIFVGRLTKVKKLNLLLEALYEINKEEKVLNLLLIGEGEIKEELIDLVNSLSLNPNVQFYGACYNEEKLANFIYFSELCVSPGNVGLTAIHSLSFGTPVCTHNNYYNQMPEVEVIKDGFNGCFFNEDSADSLSLNIQKWINSSHSRDFTREHCYVIVDEFYNPYYQLKVIKDLF